MVIRFKNVVRGIRPTLGKFTETTNHEIKDRHSRRIFSRNSRQRCLVYPNVAVFLAFPSHSSRNIDYCAALFAAGIDVRR